MYQLRQSNFRKTSEPLASDLAYVFAQLKLLNLGYREYRRDYCGKRTRRQKRAARLELHRRLRQSLALVMEDKHGEGGTS
jgi:hypothetical protein